MSQTVDATDCLNLSIEELTHFKRPKVPLVCPSCSVLYLFHSFEQKQHAHILSVQEKYQMQNNPAFKTKDPTEAVQNPPPSNQPWLTVQTHVLCLPFPFLRWNVRYWYEHYDAQYDNEVKFGLWEIKAATRRKRYKRLCLSKNKCPSTTFWVLSVPY